MRTAIKYLLLLLLVVPCFAQQNPLQIHMVTNTPQGSNIGWPNGQTTAWLTGNKSYCYNLQTNNFAVIMFTGNVTNGSNTILNISSVSGPALQVGQPIIDYASPNTLIPGGTTITNVSGTTVTISHPATGTLNGDSFSTFPHGSITFTVVAGSLPPGLTIESLNSNNNANNRQGVLTDSTVPGNAGCVATTANPFAGLNTPGNYSFAIKACDNIGGFCACSSGDDPYDFPTGDCTGNLHPMTITVANTVSPPIPVQPTLFDTTYSLPTNTPTVVGCPTNPKPGFAFQAALNAAHPGDVIVLHAGCVYNNIDATQNCGGNGCTPNEGFQVPLLVNSPPYKWIYIVGDNYSSIPAPTNRICTSQAACNALNLPKIVDGIGSNALEFEREFGTNITYPSCNAAGTCANYWRIVGIEFTGVYAGTPAHPCPTRTTANDPLGGPPGQLNNCASSIFVIPVHNKEQQPIGTNNITLDRVYIHGSTTYDSRIGFDMDIIYAALIDSFISDIHEGNHGYYEDQAANAEYTPGPLKVHNNYLAGAGETYFIGGSGTFYVGGGVFYDNPYVTQDVEITNNQIEAQIEWDSCGDGGTVFPTAVDGSGHQCPQTVWPSTCTTPGPGCVPPNEWIIKNDLEMKNVQRALVQGNLIQNSWLSGQTGSCFLFEPAAGESGNRTQVTDITAQNNIIQNCNQPITLAGQDYNCLFPAQPYQSYPNCNTMPRTQRALVSNNLLLTRLVNDGVNKSGIGFNGDNSEAVFDHNTVLNIDGSLPIESFNFGAAGFCTPSPLCNNFAAFKLYINDGYWGNNPGGDSDTILYYTVANLGWYEPNPSTPTYIQPNRLTGNVLTVPTGNGCNGGGFTSCQLDWNSNPNLPNNTAVYPSGTSLGPCQAPGGPSWGNFQLVSPVWTGHTQDGQQAGVVCATLCNTGVCGGATILTITTTNPPSGTVGTVYSFTELASGGNPPYTWTIIAGSLPPGLNFSTGGIISGTPTTAGTYSFTVKVTDTSLSTATSPQTITINNASPIITGPPTCGNGTVGTPFTCTIMGASGTPPYTLHLVFGTLPPGLSIVGLAITGTPTTCTTSCPYSFSVKLEDSNGLFSNAKAYLGTIVAGSGSPLSITTTSLPSGVVGLAYSQLIVATGGTPPYTWSLAPGSPALPTGLNLTSQVSTPYDGIVSGTPLVSGVSMTVFEVTDSATPTPHTATATLPITIVGANPTSIMKHAVVLNGIIK